MMVPFFLTNSPADMIHRFQEKLGVHSQTLLGAAQRYFATQSQEHQLDLLARFFPCAQRRPVQKKGPQTQPNEDCLLRLMPRRPASKLLA